MAPTWQQSYRSRKTPEEASRPRKTPEDPHGRDFDVTYFRDVTSGFNQADVEKQYYMNSLPWVWSNDYYNSRLHIWDRVISMLGGEGLRGAPVAAETAQIGFFGFPKASR